MKSIAGYDIVKLLAKGGMAAIYIAEQRSLQRQVVLKFLNPKLDEKIRKRFIDEGKLIASLEHPNIITVYDVVSTQKYNFIAMEYLEGGDLDNRIQEGLETSHALDILNKVSAALHVVHKQGIIHGDIKPANVIFRKNGCPVLTDFGISHQSKPKQEIHSSGEVYASPSYASPELIQGRPFDYRTDLYSLGVMMYEMLVGEKPFQGESEIETIAQSIQDPIPGLPEKLNKLQPLLDSLLAKSAEDRLSDAKLVSRYIERFFKDNPEFKKQSHETKLIDSDVVVEYVANRKVKSNRSLLLPVMVSVVLIALVLGIWLNKNRLYDHFSNTSVVAQKESLPANKSLPASAPGSELKQQKPSEISIQNSVQNSINNTDAQVLLEQKNKEIEQVKQELEKQKKVLRQKQLKRKRQIANWLKQGQKSIKDYRLTTPLNNNAIYYFQKVLEQDPDNVKAKKGIKDVVYRYELLARAELDKYHYEKAQQYISTGLGIDENSKRLQELQAEANLLNEPKRAIKKVQNFFKNL